MNFARVVMLLAVLAAAASCGLVPKTEESPAAPHAETKVADIEDAELGARAQAPADDIQQALRPPPRKPPAPEEPRMELVLSPDRMVGFGQVQTTELLGEPEWKREEGVATIWHYAADKCWMNLFFYADLATGERRVLTYEIDTQLEKELEDMKGDCIKRIRQAAGKGD